MKTGLFVEGLTNVKRFLDATRVLDARGAPEACWLLAEGEPGFGKTKTLMWYAMHHSPVFVRAKRDWSPNWMLHDIAHALAIKPAHSKEGTFNAVLGELMQRQCPLVIDEIDHAAASQRVLETLRDLTDMSETPLIAGGMKGARGMMKAYKQVYSRVAEIVTFAPATVEDVKTLAATLTEAQIGDDMAAEVQKRTGGRLREVMNAIARVEVFARKHRGVVTLADYGRRPLINDDRSRLPEAANG